LEDFKIIFYIAVAIAWVVYKNYQKVQKNRPATILPPKSTPEIILPKSNPDQMLTKKAKQKSNSAFEKQRKIKNEFKSGKIEQKKTPIFISDNNQERAAIISPIESQMIQKDKEVKNQIKNNTMDREFAEDESFNLKKFDMRTAIIYSEILKRPYV
jgi:hypothetical protein